MSYKFLSSKQEYLLYWRSCAIESFLHFSKDDRNCWFKKYEIILDRWMPISFLSRMISCSFWSPESSDSPEWGRKHLSISFLWWPIDYRNLSFLYFRLFAGPNQRILLPKLSNSWRLYGRSFCNQMMVQNKWLRVSCWCTCGLKDKKISRRAWSIANRQQCDTTWKRKRKNVEKWKQEKRLF